jgi:hypothetical protein
MRKKQTDWEKESDGHRDRRFGKK